MAARKSRAMEQRTNCLSRGGMRGVEESFAVRLWRLSGGCWAAASPLPLPGVHDGCLS